MVRGIRPIHPGVLFSRGLGGMSEQALKPLQDSTQSFLGLFFDSDPASQVNEFLQELLATVKEGGGKTVGPEGEFHEEVDPSQGPHHDVLDIELFIKIPKTLLDSMVFWSVSKRIFSFF